MQSPGVAQFFSQVMVPQEALTSQYSTLHQERLYLLNALTEEENQGERLTQILSALQTRITELEATDSSSGIKKLRPQIKAVRNKIGDRQHRERALATNLATVVMQMEGIKRYQWMTAQQEYAMQIQQAQQHAQMVLMSPARPEFALRSPGPVELVTQMRYMPLSHSPGGPLLQSFSLNPYTALGQSVAASQFVAPHPDYSQPQQLYTSALPVLRDLDVSGRLPGNIQYGLDEPVSRMSISLLSDRNRGARLLRGGRQRAVSLLMPAPTSSESAGDSFSPTKPRNDGARRRLSLLDGTSAAIRLERKAAEARSKELVE